MFNEALAAPIRSDDAAATLFMGGVLTFLSAVVPVVWLFAVLSTPLGLLLTPLAVFPSLVLRGYDVRTVRTGLRGDDATPSFVRWGELVRDGLKSVLLSVGYLLPLGVLLAVVVGLAVLLGARVVTPGSVAGVVVAVGIVVVGVGVFGYGVAYLYLRPAALTRFAAEGRLRDGFALRQVVDVARGGRYAGGWFRATAVLVGGVVVGVPTTVVVVGVFVAFYARVVAHVLYGQGAADDSTETTEATEASASSARDRRLDKERTPEVSPSVQTGRTVGVVDKWTEMGEPTSTQSDESDGDDSDEARVEADTATRGSGSFVWGGDDRDET
ncbi:DUF4013 domain-containing protein [Halogranum rubrum]|uniref:DUF4013 domain-containing protein n=1 Tax=Halogranum salarium B-1 TaxID=1210908 RepID=J2ZDY7_9EURY|nr:DUF4013 domain-containing protein [Halogranum salarium]EJN58890.1 hypothetical protein HSB1_23110 [Halogranum salarium B-1]